MLSKLYFLPVKHAKNFQASCTFVRTKDRVASCTFVDTKQLPPYPLRWGYNSQLAILGTGTASTIRGEGIVKYANMII